MKAYALHSAIALSVIACNLPDSAVFGPGAPISTGGLGASAGTSSTPGGTEAGGGSPAQGGAVQGGTSAQPSGGTEAGGTEAGAGSAGEPAEMPGAAGEGQGGVGAPPEPPKPVCGNGIIEAGEECDDANRAGMDGCEKCQVMCAHFGPDTVKSKDFHCYGGYDEADFEGAVKACEGRGGHLVTISSAEENALVRGLVNDSKFIGGWEDVAQTEAGKGNYGWITGEPLSYENWAQREPTMDQFWCGLLGLERCYEHCMVMNRQGTWEDRRCDQQGGYVCEWGPEKSAP
jgi:cysteine-rich repeat protein